MISNGQRAHRTFRLSRASLGVVAVTGALLMLVLWNERTIDNVRQERVAQITALTCANYDTLQRVIVEAPRTRPEVFMVLGFSPEQVTAITAEQDRVRRSQLVTLGPPPEECEPQ